MRSDEAGMAIPMLFQGDYKQVILYYDGTPRSVSTSGCGATSVSMIVAYLTGNTEQTPYTLFCEACDAGRYNGAGWDHTTLSHYANRYGVKTRWIRNSGKDIVEALRAGKPVIAHMGPGIFTSRGHYVVLRGVTADGKILINDPISPNKCGKAFPIQTLLTQAKGSNAFMVCWTEDGAEEADLPETAEAAPAEANLTEANLTEVNPAETPEAPQPETTDETQAAQADMPPNDTEGGTL